MMQGTDEMEQDTRHSLALRQDVSAEQVSALLTTSNLTLLYRRLLHVMLDLVEEDFTNEHNYHTLGGIANDLLEEIRLSQSNATPLQRGNGHLNA